eukprot:gene28696-35598_t
MEDHTRACVNLEVVAHLDQLGKRALTKNSKEEVDEEVEPVSSRCRVRAAALEPPASKKARKTTATKQPPQSAASVFDASKFPEHRMSTGVYHGPIDKKTGNRHGFGVMHYTGKNKGTVYTGDWVNDMRDGNGIQVSAQGDRYDGEFDLDKMHGNGEMRYANGDVYTGVWYRGKPDGEGYMNYGDGSLYEGQWVNGLPDGDEGTMTYSNGDVYLGTRDGTYYQTRSHAPQAGFLVNPQGYVFRVYRYEVENEWQIEAMDWSDELEERYHPETTDIVQVRILGMAELYSGLTSRADNDMNCEECDSSCDEDEARDSFGFDPHQWSPAIRGGVLDYSQLCSWEEECFSVEDEEADEEEAMLLDGK